MNDRVNESFSAFLDGEASEVDIQRMLKALENEPHLLDDWQRLSRVHAMLAGDVVVDAGVHSSDVATPGAAPQATSGASRWRLRLGQGALAAAVAVVVVVAGAHWHLGAAAPGVDPQVASGSDLEASQTHFEVRQRLNSYLRQHAEAASYSSGHVVVPYELYWEVGE